MKLLLRLRKNRKNNKQKKIDKIFIFYIIKMTSTNLYMSVIKFENIINTCINEDTLIDDDITKLMDDIHLKIKEYNQEKINNKNKQQTTNYINALNVCGNYINKFNDNDLYSVEILDVFNQLEKEYDILGNGTIKIEDDKIYDEYTFIKNDKSNLIKIY